MKSKSSIVFYPFYIFDQFLIAFSFFPKIKLKKRIFDSKVLFLCFFLISLPLQAHNIHITSIHELLKTHPEIEYIKCYDAQPFAYEPFPLSTFPELQPHTGLLAETFIAKIPQGQVSSYRGWIKVDDVIISEFIPPYGSLSYHEQALTLYDFNNPTKISGKVAVITMLFDTTYCHWIWNILGRLALLEIQGIEYDWLYVPYDLPFMKESLALWGIDSAKIITPFGATKHIIADELIVPSHIGNRTPEPHQYVMNWVPVQEFNQNWNLATKNLHIWSNFIYPKVDICPKNIAPHNYFLRYAPLCSVYFCQWGIQHIRNKFLSHVENNNYHFAKKIFISRKDSTKRVLTNEDELFSLFEPLGFKKYIAGSMSVQEQIALFHGADIIVAAHGSALTNALFAQPGTTIIEIYQNRSDSCFYYLSQLLDLHHFCIQTMDFLSIDSYENTCVDKTIIQQFITEHQSLFTEKEKHA